ncbi:MAG: MFS transporter, partial [Simkaniaceae bacterium]|nr:MFS transporter [Simkaniaceae bacterium]
MKESSQKFRKASLFTIFFTFAVDNLGATIVFPIFAPLFLSDTEGLFNASYPLATRTILLGLFLGAFPFAQFFLNPIFGEYADRQGRKKALLITTFITLIGFAISAWSIGNRAIVPLFLGRILMGIGAGNLSICLSSLSDLSGSPKQKLKYFSYGSAIAGLTFVLGPFVGGKLSDPQIFPYFNKAFPMWVGFFLSVINFLFILWCFRETIHEKLKGKFDLIKGLHDLRQAFNKKSLRSLYLVYFFFLFAWNIIFLFFPAYLVENYQSSSSTIGDISAL